MPFISRVVTRGCWDGETLLNGLEYQHKKALWMVFAAGCIRWEEMIRMVAVELQFIVTNTYKSPIHNGVHDGCKSLVVLRFQHRNETPHPPLLGKAALKTSRCPTGNHQLLHVAVICFYADGSICCIWGRHCKADCFLNEELTLTEIPFLTRLWRGYRSIFTVSG